MKLSHRINLVEASPTVVVNARAQALQKEGKKVINLSVGEPDFDTPDFIKKAAIDAIQQGLTKYTDTDGTPELKKAIIHKLKRDNNLAYAMNEVMASDGVKQAIYNLCQVILNPQDEVIIPAPYWVSYPAFVQLAEAKPIVISSDIHHQFKITAAQLKKAITPRTKLFFLNSPSNPTGIAYTANELRALAEVLKEYPQVLIATDDIYEYIVWNDHTFVNILNVCPALKERTIIFNGMSKAYAMTGWRLGYAAGPAPIITAMKKLQSQSTTNPCSISQAAGTIALASTRRDLLGMINTFKERHDFLFHEFSHMNNIDCCPADGTFYLFPEVSRVMKKLGMTSDIELATYLLDQTLIATVPGSAFGMPHYIRFSYAADSAILKEAVVRLRAIFA